MKKTTVDRHAAGECRVCGSRQAAWQPDKPVEFVVTSGAGGGTDNFARTSSRSSSSTS